MAFWRRRLLSLVGVLALVTLGSYLLLDLLPGGPEVAILGPTADADRLAQVRADLDLDDPFLARYARWVGDVAQGDLGRSYDKNRPVADMVRERVPVTLELVVLAQLLALVIAVPVAALGAARPGSLFDKAASGASFVFVSVPGFVIGIVLVLVLAVKLDWFPASEYTRLGDDVSRNLHSMVLPALTLALGQAAIYSRILRADLLETLEQDFIAAARGRGLSRRRVMVRHALRPSSLTLVTVVGLNFGTMLGGSVVVERLFSLPGMGKLMLDAIPARDFTVVQGVTLFVAVAFVAVNLLVDVLYTVLDPRIRHAPHG
jgi:peptide/nickel transport system permease protein